MDNPVSSSIMEVGFDWRRDRVGKTSKAVEASTKKEVGEAVGEAPVWAKRWSGRRSTRHRGGRGGGAGARRGPDNSRGGG
jgi:hypothetical protein